MRPEHECAREAVTECYGARFDFSFEDTPDATGKAQLEAWNAWAEARGLQWWWSDELAPVSMPRWIAYVVSRQPEFPLHAVAMRYDRVMHDPPIGDGRPWTTVRKEDIHSARMLMRADDPTWGKDLQFWELAKP